MRQKIWGVLVVVCAAGNILWRSLKTDVVINSGVRMWNTISEVLLAALLLSCCAAVISLVFTFRQKQEKEREVEKHREAVPEKKAASLSMKGQLNTDTIAGLLTDTINGEDGDWSRLKLQLMECREQLYKMDRYQEKLHGLLLENDAERLNNTEEIVARVEQYMLQNTRKICNYVQIYDSLDEEGFAKTAALTQTCLEDNKQQLAHVQDLLSAIADFLNSQGQDSTALDAMEIYKKTILETIEQGGKHV